MKAILCVDKEWNIGKDDKLIFNIPDDMKRFKEITTNKVVIMGRKTYESIGKSLPNRTNIIISSNKSLIRPSIPWNNTILVDSLDELFDELDFISDTYSDDDVFVIGGANIYDQLIPYCNELYITMVDAYSNGNIAVTPLSEDEWEKIEEVPMHTNGMDYSFTKWIRKDQ